MTEQSPSPTPQPTDRTTLPTTTDQAAGVRNHPAVARVVGALQAAGVVDAAQQVTVLDDHARTAAAAAAQLGVEVAQIANSLVFAVPDDAAPGGRRPLLILTSGAHRVDTAKVAAALGVSRLDRADADFVRERTGFVIGGVAPVGHTDEVQTLVDSALAGHDQVWAAAGHARTVFPTTHSELLRITGGVSVEVA
jgi:prolyl-tRNA editing enzyme YbaK/EbsC (Cys-tRNA(Pro) deacylase)